MKHSAAGDCTVTVSYRADDLTLEITDPGPAVPGGSGSGSGHGITGMRERVTLCGGGFSAGPGAGGGFRVSARLPLDGDAA